MLINYIKVSKSKRKTPGVFMLLHPSGDWKFFMKVLFI
jgi:hypothetical protein